MTDRITRPRQERFRRHFEFVVVRPIRLNATTTLQPGEEIAELGLRLGHIRSLYHRRRLGRKGSAWADFMLAKAAGLESQEAAEAVDEKRQDEPNVERAEAAAAREAVEDARAATAAATGEDDDTLIVDLEGSAGGEGGAEPGVDELTS